MLGRAHGTGRRRGLGLLAHELVWTNSITAYLCSLRPAERPPPTQAFGQKRTAMRKSAPSNRRLAGEGCLHLTLLARGAKGAGPIQPEQQSGVAVGTAVTCRPPHRSVRAELPHTAPASGM